ncbi:antibiotic biosynthesis monooxygenase family protein [Roseibium aggregatum]|uniref:Antibiotic biosynthesis monooxygenase n=1 Tax=Roseibium aggregatum TaxID=187304 RepID=A0A926NX87_9HYPH|nr:antibiotic biosynthesis monooxygenase [Roseibium aggregatum]MBD1548089.1 antibiotic biosynthesis monooxygenase [Roseibium aggregatum]
MFLAMNRFRVNKGQESAFEEVWKSRDSQLEKVPGFQSFHLMKGPEAEDGSTVLYASHTIWASKDDFIAWTKSEHFRNAHKNAGDNKGLYAGHPEFEGFEAVEGA